MILETKLTLPQPKAGALLRTALIERIKNNLDKKLILITADAGYGKTTLLAQLVKAAKLPCMFYDLDKSDSDLMGFYTYLVNGIKQIDPALVKYSEELLKSAAADGAVRKNIELLFGTLINELYRNRREELFIILDNYHNLAEESIVHSALDFFIDHLPDKVRIILSSRSAPPLPSIAKWRAKQDLIVLSREHLAFSGDEISALIKDIYTVGISEANVRQIAARTEGWITGIQLILQSAGRDETTIGECLKKQLEVNRPLFDYFTDEIFSREPQPLRIFMAKCSILDVMTPAVCAAVTGEKDSERILKRLERRHLFISAVGNEEYKYHHLFREFLQKRLKDDREFLHRTAANYYKRQGNAEQAVEHYLEAGNFAEAWEVMDRNIDIKAVAGFPKLSGWLQRIPRTTMIKHPKILLESIKVLGIQGRLDEAKKECLQTIALLKKTGNRQILAETLYEYAIICYKTNDHALIRKYLKQSLAVIRHSQMMKRARERLMGLINNLSACVWLELGNIAKAKTCLLQARRLCHYAQYPYAHYIVESNIALLYNQQGEERSAYNVFRSLIANIEKIYFYEIGIIFFNASIASLNLNNITWAGQILNRGWDLCQPYDDPLSKAYLKHGFGVLFMHKAQWGPAIFHLNEAAEMMAGLKVPPKRGLILRDLSLAYLYQGDYAKAQEYLNQAKSESGDSVKFKASLQIEQSLLEAGCHRFEAAGKLIKNCQIQVRKFGWNRLIFQSQLASARIFAGQGKEKQAMLSFRKAVSLAKLKGYDGLLARELRASPKLVSLSGKCKLEPEYLGRILSQSSKYSPEAGEPSLSVQLLGGFELIEGGAGKNTGLKRKITKAILAFFLLHPEKSFSWEEIAAWAWPDSPAASANHLFRNAVWEVHRNVPALKSAIIYEGKRHALKPKSPVKVDALEFCDLLRQAEKTSILTEKLQLLEKAVSLYQGPLLPGYYYLWADDLRNAYEEEYTRALAFLAKRHHDDCDFEKSSRFCRLYLGTDQLNEEIHRLLIDDCLRLGLQSEAINQYARLKNILHKHLRSKPSAETEALMQTACKTRIRGKS